MHLHDLALRPGAVAPPHPDALLLRDGRWSRDELHQAVVAMAGPLATLAPPGGRIVIAGDNRPEVVALILAIPAAGRVAVPLDIRLPAEEMAARVEASGATAVIGTAEGLGRLGPLLAGGPSGRTSIGLDRGAGDITLTSLIGAPAPAVPLLADPDAPAWMLFSPRSAARATILTARDLCRAVKYLSATRPLADDDVYLHPFPLDQASAIHLLHALHRGRPVVLPHRFDPIEVAGLLRDHAVTTLAVAPSLLRALLDHGARTDEPAVLAGLRAVTCTAIAPPALLAEATALGLDVEVIDAAGLVAGTDPEPSQ